MSGFDPESLKGIAAECPGFHARATARAVTRYYNDCFKPFGLTAEQFSLLVGVGTAEGATIVDLAESAGVDATTLSRNVQALEKRDLLQIKGGRGRAGKQLGLTASGHQLLMDALPVWQKAKSELSRRVGDAQLQAATQAMAVLAKAAKSARL